MGGHAAGKAADWRRHLAVAFLYLLLYFLLNWLSVKIMASKGVSLKYLPEGLSLALLIGYGTAYAPLLLIRPFLGGLWFYAVPLDFVSRIALGSISALVYVFTAHLLRSWMKPEIRLVNPRSLARFTVAALAGTALVTLAMMSLSFLLDAQAGMKGAMESFFQKAFRIWMGESLGILTLAPFLIINVFPRLKGMLAPDPLIRPRGETAFPRFGLASLLETAGQMAAVALAVGLVFAPGLESTHRHYYFCFIPIIWIAMRKGLPGATLAALAINFSILVAISEWDAPFRDAADLQLFILAITLTSLFLGAAVSERKETWAALHRSEARLMQFQKLEAVDRLAGGVAHEFNNLLTAINGYSDIVLGKMEAQNPFRKALQEIRKAGERAARLTDDLLTFSRGRVAALQETDLGSLLADMEGSIRKTVEPDISFTLRRPGKPTRVMCLPRRLEQVVMELVLNSRDALDRPGHLEVRVDALEIRSPVSCFNGEIGIGTYAVLTVADTGHGMDEAVEARMFEPFFTTKQSKKEAGLGLSAVYGIVEQCGGKIGVDSAPGRGTAVRLFFPLVAADSHGRAKTRARPLCRRMGRRDVFNAQPRRNP